MNWDDLRFVLEVGRRRTLAAAGRALGVDPTTVGRRIFAIEKELGSRLFDRTGDGYIATHAGQIAIAHAKDMENMSMSLSRQVDGSDKRIEGPVRLTALDAMFDALIIPKLPRLLKRHPGLVLTFSSSWDFLDLSRREADIALRVTEPTHPDAVGRRLGRQALGVYAALDLELVDAPPIIGLPRDNESTRFSGFLHELFPRSPIVARGNTEGHILALTRAGIGVGLVDCFVGDADPLLRRVLPEPVDHYDVWAVVHVEMHKSPRVRSVMDFLTEVYSEEADLIEGRRPQAQ